MAVYTEVSPEAAQKLATHLQLGTLRSLKGIHDGIENTNYFLSTESASGRHEYVLTIFERLSFEELPYYLHLMQHLAAQGIHVPMPQADSEGNILHRLVEKPCCVVNKLPGSSVLNPDVADCKQVASMLAQMHLAGLNYPKQQPNLRGLAWWNETLPLVLPHLNKAQTKLIQTELERQNTLASTPIYAELGRGPIHADLFRNNVLFSHNAQGQRSCAFFDFYFAGTDAWLFDIAVCLNDWCMEYDRAQADTEKQQAFLAAYTAVRPLSAAEQSLLPDFLRAAALRFWISRLWDFYLPRSAKMLKAHDPAYFERILRHRSL